MFHPHYTHTYYTLDILVVIGCGWKCDRAYQPVVRDAGIDMLSIMEFSDAND
jgi:hypothetical protein